MRLVTYRDGSKIQIGAVESEVGIHGEVIHEVVDLSAIAPDMLSLIALGPAGLAQARDALATSPRRPLEAVQLLAPIPRPHKNITCLGMNYALHAYESARSKGQPEVLPPYPVFFTKAVTAVNRPDGEVPLWSQVTSQLDWEVELGFIIGTGGTFIAPEDALKHVFGYTIVNDVSARDIQNRHQQFFRGKSLDGTAPMGPWIVTADEIPDPHALGLRLRVNGETLQDSTTADLIFKIPEIISTFSSGTTLEPGDIFITGTPSGVGMGMQPPRWLKAGDVMEAEIDGIGVLRNTVV
jgi:2-keto-4-pentenoate hydratase/2-oxohepta-3-ene-1,7-dioic acid hydratase in catechol pathway